MKKSVKSLFLLLALITIFEGLTLSKEAEACWRCYDHGGGSSWGWGGGAASGFGYGNGRFPLYSFPTPLRPWGGITPIRQFWFGRGRDRRMNRRAFLFG